MNNLFDAEYEHTLRRHAEEASAILWESEQRLIKLVERIRELAPSAVKAAESEMDK